MVASKCLVEKRGIAGGAVAESTLTIIHLSFVFLLMETI